MSELPVVFVSHGAPTLALQTEHPWSKALRALGERLPRPRAAAVISGHWQERNEFAASGSLRPETVHDFGNFGPELHAIEYPAPGDPALARELAERLAKAGFKSGVDEQRGLDHGAWVPLRQLFPRADVPVVQLSLPHPTSAAELLRAGEALAPLRREGVLLIGSGGTVHNLRRISWHDDAPPEKWALDFDRYLWEAAQRHDLEALENWRSAPGAELSHPSSEHLEPVFVALGATRKDEPVSELHASFSNGNLSLRSFAVGDAG